MSKLVVNSVPPSLRKATYKRRIWSWALYDSANSAFAVTVLAVIMPVYYSQVAGSTLPSAAVATQYWSLSFSISIFIVALLSPVLGTLSDIKQNKKKLMAVLVIVGVTTTSAFIFVDNGDWLLASVILIIGRTCYASANVLYDSFLPHLTTQEEQDRVSTIGYAVGYMGSGLFLLLNVLTIQLGWFAGNWGFRVALFSVAIWWALFALPLFLYVPEPKSAVKPLAPHESVVRVTFSQIWQTLQEISHFRELFKFLIAFLIYNDGIGIVAGMATVYGAELGFRATELILAALMIQFVSIPYSLIFGSLPTKNERQPVWLALILFNMVCVPLVGIGGNYLLPQTITGKPSPPFAGIDTAVGQGIYQANSHSALSFIGDWHFKMVAGDLRGAESSAPYAETSMIGNQITLIYHGQQIAITYSTGPSHGIWHIAIDGEPPLDENGQVTTPFLDTYHAQQRYNEVKVYNAGNEGLHTLTLTNTNKRHPESQGYLFSISQIEVKSPLLISSLWAILGILLGAQLIGLIFAFKMGTRLFGCFTEQLTTQNSILLALSIFIIIVVWSFFLDSVLTFWCLAWLTSVVLGGSQALSRSLYATLSPTMMSGKFFGLFSIMTKFSAFFSPLLVAFIIGLYDSTRPAMLSVIIFIVAGMLILRKVDVPTGKRVADEKNAQLLAGH